MYEAFYETLIAENRWMLYVEGLLNTLKMAAFATLLGILIGLFVSSVKFSRDKNLFLRILAGLFDLYTTIIRATPVLLQLLIINGLIFTSRNTNIVFVGGLCFGINSGAYVSEIFRGAIQSIDKGQVEAGRSLGLSHSQTLRSIVLPQAFKNAIPALGNEFIMLIKETSVASVIAVNELIKVANNITSRTFDTLPPLYVSACIYIILVLIAQYFQSKIERRLQKDA